MKLTQIRSLLQKQLNQKIQNQTSIIQEMLLPLIQFFIMFNDKSNPPPPFLIAFLLPLSFLQQMTNVVNKVVKEKEKKMYITAKIMGMSQLEQMISVIIFELTQNSLVCIQISLFFIIFGWVSLSQQFELLQITLMQSLGLVSYGLMMTTLFSTASLATLISVFLMFIPIWLFEFIQTEASQLMQQLSIDPPQVQFQRMLIILNQDYDDSRQDYVERKQLDQQLQGGILLFLMLFLIFDRVLPNEFGVRESIFTTQITTDWKQNQLNEQSKYSVQIDNLTKEFSSTKALENFSINICPNTIQSVLGHNGAGKTTLINLLTGVYEPTSGDAFINGHSIREEMSKIRESMGVCPQIDILQDELTIVQHMELALGLKNLQVGDPNYNLEETLELVGLKEKDYNNLTKECSGGMKRKLSLAMALAGNPKILFLDEPTSALDTEIRSQVRKIIKKLKADRTIILTTQHMDEAEELSDQIAFMSKGKLSAEGTVDEIKSKFGIGQHLIIRPIQETDVIADADNIKIKEIVSSNIEDFKYDCSKSEIKILLPFDKIDKQSKILHSLDNFNYQISIEISSLEEAFINFMQTEDTKSSTNPEQTATDTNISQSELDEFFHSYQPSSFLNQLAAIIVRRAITNIRSCEITFMMLLPLVMMAIFCIMFAQFDFDDQAGPQIAIAIVQIFCSFQSFCSGVYLQVTVKERDTGVRQMQQMSGVHFVSQWIAMCLADFLFYTIISIAISLFVYFVGLNVIVESFGMITLSFVLFGQQMIVFSQCFAFLFTDPIFGLKFQGQVCQILFHIIPNFGADQLRYLINQNNTYDFSLQIDTLLTFSPFFCMQNIMNYISSEQLDNGAINRSLLSAYSLLGFQCLWIVIQFVITISIDYFEMNKFKNGDGRTKDYEDWQKYLPIDENLKNINFNESNSNDSFKIKVGNLHKVYLNDNQAVAGLDLNIKEGEIMGLLGPNGAGKSTTFNMLTMKEQRSTGSIQLLGQEIGQIPQDDFSKISICPQENMLFDQMTIYEHLYFQSAVKGINQNKFNSIQAIIMKYFDLESFQSTQAVNLSGGNKRKLICAICLLGSPSVTFLDEPTTGVDPVARTSVRQLLKMLAKMEKSSYVFTTHWMSEAEQMCDRVCILVNGRIITIGSLNQLRQKQGDGYRLTINLDFDHEESITNAVKEIDQEQSKEDWNVGSNEIVFKIKSDINLGMVFDKMLELQNRDQIKYFNISQCSLENIFIKFVRYQKNTEKFKEIKMDMDS